MAVLDSTMVSIALPVIGRNLGIGAVDSIWIVNAYQISIVAALLPSAALGGRFGYRRMFAGGLALFLLASLACALAGSLAALIAARVVQGLAAAAMSSTATVLVRFTSPASRLGRGIAFNGLVVALSGLAGPGLASAILAFAGWPWLFACNLPIGLAALAMVASLPEKNGEQAGAVDWTAAGWSAMAFGCLFLGLDGLAHHRLATAGLLLIAAAGAGRLLWRRDCRQALPLLPLDLLGRPAFLAALLRSAGAYAAQMAAYVCLPFQLAASGRTPAQIGLLLTCWPLALALCAPLSGRLGDRFSPAPLARGGLLILAAGLAFLAFSGDATGNWQMAAALTICGGGFVLFQTPNNQCLLLAAPPERSGAASGLLGLARVFGQTAGATIAALGFAACLGSPGILATAAGLALAAALIGQAARRG